MSVSPAAQWFVDYKRRSQDQLRAWAFGISRHNDVDDECCPDFSCCHPDLKDDDAAARWRFYCAEYPRPKP